MDAGSRVRVLNAQLVAPVIVVLSSNDRCRVESIRELATGGRVSWDLTIHRKENWSRQR